MKAYLEAFQRGPGRVCIVGARNGSAAARLMGAWLPERIDVLRFEQRAGSGVFYADYDDGIAIPGRFMRSLRARTHAINHVAEEAFEITPVHSLRGRIRLRVAGVNERQLVALTARAATLPGVKSTRHIPGGRTILVEYDPEVASEDRILATLLKSDTAELTREWVEPASIRWGGALAGTWTLFLCLTGALSFPWLAVGGALNTLRPLARSIRSEERLVGEACSS